MSKFILPSLLAVSRAVQLSAGTLFSINTEDPTKEVPIRIQEMTVRGSISNYGDAYGAKTGKGKSKGDKLSNPDAPNPQTVDAAFLQPQDDRVRLSFSLKAIPLSCDLVMCNDAAMTQRLSDFLEGYRRVDGFRTLAGLIAWATAAALPLWRNRYGVDLTVTVRDGLDTHKKQLYSGDADSISVKCPDYQDEPLDRAELVTCLAEAFSGQRPLSLLYMTMESTLGRGQEVYPSQDFAHDAKEKKSRLLFSVSDGRGGFQAALHPQKIWAALRMIDVWHAEFDRIGPLTVEPLGYSHQHQQAFRKPDKHHQDLYSCLNNIDTLIEQLQAGHVSDQSHFLAANLMRGGVFSAAGGDKAKATKDTADASVSAESDPVDEEAR